MLLKWEDRSVVTANLLNPAFCGEVIRRAGLSYNAAGEQSLFPFSLAFLVLPIVLHKRTREALPKSTATYFHSWVELNEHLFIDFAERTRELLPYSREALLFLSHHKAIYIEGNGIAVTHYKKTTSRDEHGQEVNEIFKRAEFLGRWFKQTGNEQTIYMFLKIQP